MRILSQAQPILILPQLPLMRSNLRSREMIRTLTTNTQSRLPVQEDLNQTVTQREDTVAVRIRWQGEEIPHGDIRLSQTRSTLEHRGLEAFHILAGFLGATCVCWIGEGSGDLDFEAWEDACELPVDDACDEGGVVVCDEDVAGVEVGMAEDGCAVVGEDGKFVEEDWEDGFDGV